MFEPIPQIIAIGIWSRHSWRIGEWYDFCGQRVVRGTAMLCLIDTGVSFDADTRIFKKLAHRRVFKPYHDDIFDTVVSKLVRQCADRMLVLGWDSFSVTATIFGLCELRIRPTETFPRCEIRQRAKTRKALEHFRHLVIRACLSPEHGT